MPNTLATPTWVTKETARGYTNGLKFAANVNRTYSDEYEQSGAKVGNTIFPRLPQRWQVTDGQALQLQNILDQTVSVTLTNQKNVAFGYSSAQATTELDMIRQRYTQPAAEALANATDVLGFATVTRDIYSSVGTPGTTPSTTLGYLQAGVKLTDLAAPMDGRIAMLDQLAMATIANTSSSLFLPGIVGANYRSGQFGANQLGIAEWYQDPNRYVHTTGSWTSTSTPLTTTASQTGSTLATNGWNSNTTTLNKGDVFTIAGVNSVNPLSYTSTGRLQQFVVTATTSDSGGAIAALPFAPPIITSGQLQTVDAAPAGSAVITVLGASAAAAGTFVATTSPQSLVYHPDAFALVTADLTKNIKGAECTRVSSKALNFSIRLVEQYQIGTDQNPSRLDILIGWATIQARLACRVWG